MAFRAVTKENRGEESGAGDISQVVSKSNVNFRGPGRHSLHKYSPYRAKVKSITLLPNKKFKIQNLTCSVFPIDVFLQPLFSL